MGGGMVYFSMCMRGYGHVHGGQRESRIRTPRNILQGAWWRSTPDVVKSDWLSTKRQVFGGPTRHFPPI